MKKLTKQEEGFAQSYLEQKNNASAAYRLNYKTDDANANTVNRKASEVKNRPHVAARIKELQGEHREEHNITVGDLLKEFEEARQIGIQEGNPSAMVAATMGKAKILGLDKQIIEAKTEGNISIDIAFD